jgi:hypothetical protein
VNRQPHPDGAKAQARTIFEAHGSRKAAEVTGISRRTVNAWVKAEGWQRRLATGQAPNQRLHVVAPVADAEQAPNKRPVATGYTYQRRLLLRQLGDEAGACLTALAKDREAGKSGAARNWAWCVGILLERAELLAKAAGPDQGGHLDPAASIARMREMAADLRARAQGDGRA